MPISLNNSNISVQYNTGSNYIIETVKSDVFVRGTTSGNLSSEPTTSPNITSNIAIFTHSGGTENQTPHTIFFPENTVCDILIVGGGGAGGFDRGGGGGAGGLVFQTNIVLSGKINISVGRGGTVSSNDTTPGGNGLSSSIGSIIALGGGGGGPERANASDGGSGGGSAYAFDMSHFGTGLQPTSSSGGYGNRGGDARDLTTNYQNRGAGGGGGAGSRGLEATSTVGGAGGNGLSGVGNVDFKTHFNLPTDNTIGHYISQEDKVYFAGGGGSGECIDGQPSPSIHGLGGKGGGSNGATNTGVMGSSLQNSGGGGGGGGDAETSSQVPGSNGGSGIVIIKVISPTTNKHLFFNYKSPPNVYTLTFPTRTIATINNSSDKLLNGSYTVTIGTTQTSIIPSQNQYLQERLYPTSNLAIRYHLLNPIKTTEGAQWTYSSSNTNVYHLGSVGIGTTSPEYSLDVRGNIFTSVGGYTQTGTENWIIQSDRRIKENIVKASYEKCLDNIKKIELYNFNFKENYVKTNDRNQLGFIAQEVQEVYPKAIKVITNDKIEELLTLNTTQIKYTLYGAVKSLIEKVENLEMRVDKLYKIAIPDVDIIEIFESTSNISIITSNISTSNLTTNLSNIDKR